MRKLTHDEISTQRLSTEEILLAERFPIYAMLDNVRSLYNVGSMFRSSDGARLTRLFLTGYTPCPPRKEIEKTALGSTGTVPWEHYRNPLDVIEQLRRDGITICVLEQTTSSKPHFGVSRSEFPICLVVGNEITGVSPEIVTAADMAIEIPMFGTKQSLNAAVAYGIALFELVRVWTNRS